MYELPTTCGFCSCGCALYIGAAGERVKDLSPSQNHPASNGKLCVKGWNATASALGPDRLRTPLIRKEGRLEPASWEEAISRTAAAIERASSESGPQSIGVIGSAKTTNEECYSLVKFARSVIGTPNIDGACRFYDASIIPALLETVGEPASHLDLDSLSKASSILIVGANVMEQLPMVGSRIIDAVENGCKVVAVDPRTSRLEPVAHLFLHPLPGADLIWLRALIATIIERKLYVKHAPEAPGFEELRLSVAGANTGSLKDASGLEADQIAEAAEIISKGHPPVIMFGLGVLQQADSTMLVKALADVAILLGGLIAPLRGQNNVQGACDMGLAHDLLPGYRMLADADSRKAWEKAWECHLPEKPGASAVEMIRGCGSGDIKALMVFGENVALSAPNTEQTQSALEQVGFLAVSDLYLTETVKLAHVVFPACSFLEKDGTFTNIERRIQRVRRIVEPLGESKSDLEIICALAAAMGKKMDSSPAQIMSEISRHVSQYNGASYSLLDESWGEPWPLGMTGERLAPIPQGRAPEFWDHQFRLVASRINFHQQTGTMAAKCPILTREYPEPFAELNQNDAERLGIRPGSRIKISSGQGSLERTMVLSDSLPAGCVHVPHFFDGDSPNRLASYDCDLTSGVPTYKSCAVQVEAIR